MRDLTQVTGYTRFQLDGFLEQVFTDVGIGNRSRVQRTFTPQDLLLVAVMCEVEHRYGIDRKKLAKVAHALRKTLAVPRPANRNARLLLSFEPPAAQYLDSDALVAEGIVLPLGSIFAEVDEYLGVSTRAIAPAQSSLRLPPTMATVRRSGSRER
jgi:hypothetical protein